MNIKQKGEAEVYNMSKMDNYTSKENLKSTKKVSNIPNPCEMILTTIQQSGEVMTYFCRLTQKLPSPWFLRQKACSIDPWMRASCL